MQMQSQMLSATCMSCVLRMTVAPPRRSSRMALAEHFGAHRIEAAEGLVEDQQLGRRNHRGDELHLLAHALAERLHLCDAHLARSSFLSQLSTSAVTLRPLRSSP